MDQLRGSLSPRGVISGEISTLTSSGVVAEPMSITENGRYVAPSGKAYSPVDVDVPIPPGYYDMTGEFAYFGLNAQKVAEYSTGKTYLKDTGFATWVPSTARTEILASYAIGTYAADMSLYDYILMMDYDMHFAYLQGTEQKAIILREMSTFCYIISKRAINKAQIDAYDESYTSSVTLAQTSLLQYFSTNGTETCSWVSNSGIYPSLMQPSMSSTVSDNPTITINTPPINAQCANAYLPADKAILVDKDASYFTCDFQLIQVDRRSMTSALNWRMIEKYHS